MRVGLNRKHMPMHQTFLPSAKRIAAVLDAAFSVGETLHVLSFSRFDGAFSNNRPHMFKLNPGPMIGTPTGHVLEGLK